MRTLIVTSIFLLSTALGFAQEPRFSWKRIGPDGGNVCSFLDLDSILLVGTTSGGMYRSTDNGQTWNNSRFLPLDIGEGIVQQFATAHGRTFAAIGGQIGNVARTLYVSDDKGLTWKANPITNQSFVRIHLLEATNDSLLFITTSFSGAGGDPFPKTLRSEDGGRSWQTLDILLGSVVDDFPILYTSNNLVRIGNIIFYPDKYQGLLTSENNGRTWRVSSFPQFATNRYNISRARPLSLVTLNSRLFMGIDSSVYVSRDTGRTWQATNFRIPAISQQRTPVVVSSLVNMKDTLVVSVNPTFFDNIGQVYTRQDIANGVILVSGDEGRSWITRPQHQAISNTLPLQLIPTKRSLFLIPQDREIVAATNRLWRSDNNGLSWQSVQNGIQGFLLTTLISAGNRLLAFNRFDATCFSISSSLTPSRVVSSTNIGFMQDYFSIDTVIFATEGFRLYRSNDYWASWQTLRQQDSSFAAGIRHPLYLDGIIVALNQRQSPNLWSRSTDTGKSWQPIVRLNAGSSRAVSAVAVDSTTKALYVRQNDTLFQSSDKGLTWRVTTDESAMNRALSLRVGSIFLQPFGSFTSAFSPSYNALYSRDSARTFASSFLGLPSTLRIQQFMRKGDNLYAATSRGIYVSDISTSIQKQGIENRPTMFVISPNPTEYIANFSFSLTVPSTVQCEVIDLLGRSVLSRITEEYGTGEQNISFSVEGLPSGVYSVRLTVRTAASVHTETVRLMVVK
jgi:photosystem II stability/assembly factor-like uncharacterized protein